MATPGPDPMTTGDIGRRLGVSRTRAAQLAARPDFPRPARTVGRVRVWHAADIEAWIAVHRPAGAAPPAPAT